jgi:hypothetical protein
MKIENIGAVYYRANRSPRPIRPNDRALRVADSQARCSYFAETSMQTGWLDSSPAQRPSGAKALNLPLPDLADRLQTLRNWASVPSFIKCDDWKGRPC